jgi:ribosomal-protein-alanine N-acetyltransferase
MKWINGSLSDELFPVLSTSRLNLRQLSLNDGNGLFILRSSAEVNQYLERQKPASTADSEAFIRRIEMGASQNKWIYWAISLTDETALIGSICLWNFNRQKHSAEIGYELLPEFQCLGLMSEAVKVVLDYGFNTLKLRRIFAYTHKDNHRSLKLLENNQFNVAEEKSNSPVDMICFSRTNI